MRYIPFALAFLLMFLNVPVGISLISASLVYFAFITDTMPLTSVIQILVTSNMSVGLLALPFFMCIGEIMNATGITRRLMNFCDTLVGHKVGGLAHVNVLLSTFNGGLTGSGAADASVQCKILVPEMEKHGYPKDFSAAVTAASGMIAPIIPPGNHMIIYCTMVGCSVARMFAAGYLPGILMCVMQMITVSVISHKNHYPPSRDTRASFKEIALSFINSIWAILIALVLVIGVRFGWFTITEGAIVIVALCIIIGKFQYKELKFKQLPKLLENAFRETSKIMIMIMGALLFGNYLSYARIPQDMAKIMTSITDSKFGFLCIAMLLVFFFGMLLDGTALMMVMTPLLYPIAEQYGINPYAFGMLIILNAQVGSLTPPVGGLMYICCNMCDVPMPAFVKKALPFIIGQVLLIIFFMLFPDILSFIPNLIYS